MKSIAAKMARAARAVGYGVPKDGQNEQQRYSYVSSANVKVRAGIALGDVGVAVSSRADVLGIDSVTTKNGSVHQRVMVKVALTFIDGESGESLTVEGLGSGMDSGDKAVMKAYTAAEKYGYISAFTLALGEDPEADPSVDEPLSAPLRKFAYGPEEQSRADARAATDDALARGLIGDFTALTHVDQAHPWVSANMRAIDALGEPHRKMVRKACGDHVKSGLVEGYSFEGYKEAWNAAVIAVRGPRGGKGNGAG